MNDVERMTLDKMAAFDFMLPSAIGMTILYLLSYLEDHWDNEEWDCFQKQLIKFLKDES